MLEIINKPLYERFKNLCAAADENIKLCAPFVKQDITDDILITKKESVRVELVTNINLRNLYQKSSDISAIQRVADSHGAVYAYSKP